MGSTKRQLRWFQVRLRTVVFGFAGVAVLLGLFGLAARPYLKQSEVANAIVDAGGSITARPGPRWLQAILGEAHCQDITLVNLADVSASQQILAQVAELPAVEVLLLGGDAITDETLQFIPNCVSLQAVVLDSTDVSDDALQAIRQQRPRAHIGRCDRQFEQQLTETRAITVTEKKIIEEWPAGLESRLPPGFLNQIIGLAVIPNPRRLIGEEDLRLIARLAGLEELSYSDFPRYQVLRGNSRYRPAVSLENQAELIRLSVVLPHLKRLALHLRDLSWMDGLDPIPQLESLTIRTSKNTGFLLSDSDLTAILQLFPQLKELDLMDAAASSPELWPAAPLEGLSLFGSNIDDDDLEVIARRFPRLKSLCLISTEVTDEGLRYLLSLSELRELRLNDARITDESYETFRKFQKLERITIGTLALNTSYYGPDGRLMESGPLLDDEARRLIAAEDVFPDSVKGETWQQFDPENYRVAPARIENLRRRLAAGDVVLFPCQSTTFLGLTPIESLHVDALRLPADVAAVDCTDTYLDNAGLEHLCNFPQIELLRLQNTWVTDAGMQHLPSLSRLKSLDLADTRVTNAGIKLLAEMPSLEYVRLPVTADGSCVDALLSLPNLRYVQVHRISMDRRPWSAKRLTVEDVRQFRRLAEALFSRADADNNGLVTIVDFRKIFAFSPLNPEGDRAPVKLTSADDLLRNMLYRCLFTPEAEQELNPASADN